MTQNLIRNVQHLNSFVLNISAFLSSGSRTQDEQYSSREALACFVLQWRACVCDTWSQPAGPAPCALPSAAGRAPVSAARPAGPRPEPASNPLSKESSCCLGSLSRLVIRSRERHQGGTSARPVSRVFDIRSWRTPGTIGCPAVSAQPSLYEPHGSQSVPLIWQLVK